MHNKSVKPLMNIDPRIINDITNVSIRFRMQKVLIFIYHLFILSVIFYPPFIKEIVKYARMNYKKKRPCFIRSLHLGLFLYFFRLGIIRESKFRNIGVEGVPTNSNFCSRCIHNEYIAQLPTVKPTCTPTLIHRSRF